MPTIRPSADLHNNYNEISDFCHAYAEPVFITKEGKGDLAVMSIESYDRQQAMEELYALVAEGLEAERSGDVFDLDDAIDDIRKGLE